ncbi:MAG: N-acetylmuramic acid 6-phosphate etherase [Sphingomonas sp.]|uniref:N-acetylmuramic acid 6-phosphate etherase n=1 Tax=Sphingomonas sp. TaxID=28214 RepID=UPI0025E5A2EA|nr:N-acetylmuramic acid 6-phosphate etherase [Sphingomonas sp.]MBX3565301.1 N-acetylmuramic acid 6-phosphate etherase [Sphingomonas sp.]
MTTETIDPRYVDIDMWPTEAAVEAILASQIEAVEALKSQAGALAAATDAAAERLRGGGRIAYAGAGTSGRIGVQDGVELTPTFGWPEARLVFLMAGGAAALMKTQEGAEDDRDAARADVEAAEIGAGDVLIGIAASGRTPYVLAAIEAARDAGALTIGVSNNAGAPLLALADHGILADTGSEVIAGSTRMKAGTAQKVALNTLSTAIMLRLGLVHRGLMVNMQVSNAKLLSRGQAMVRDLAGVDPAAAAAALAAAENDIKLAVLLAKGLDAPAARALLARSGNNLRRALDDA